MSIRELIKVTFFGRVADGELTFETSELVAFGSTRRPMGKIDDDTTLKNLVAARTGICCIVAKSWDYHVVEALRTTLDEGVMERGVVQEYGLVGPVTLTPYRQIMVWEEDVDDPREFMETLKVDFFSDEVFVFSPGGDVFQLPRGATPLKATWHCRRS